MGLLYCFLTVTLRANQNVTGLAMTTFGVGFGNFQSVGQAVSLSLVSRSRFAQATTTFFIFFDFGIGLGPYLFGFLVPIIGYNGMYLALSGTVLCALAIYYILHGKHMYEMK